MITIVSGNMRCGSSLVMRMLGAGGMPLFCTQPESFEHEAHLGNMEGKGDRSWVADGEGKALKWLDPVLHGGPPLELKYRIITLTRDAVNQHRSQVRFLTLLGVPGLSESQTGRRALHADNARLTAFWEPYGPVLPITFEGLCEDPLGMATEIADFCELPDPLPLAAQVLPRSALVRSTPWEATVIPRAKLWRMS